MDQISILVPSIAAIATALFGIWRWSSERRADRKKEEARLAALYINPFVSACEDLQSRLYNILEFNALPALRERSPKNYISQTLYLIFHYFVWARIVYRYGPLTRDRNVVALTEIIRDLFSTNDLGLGGFCFFRVEQDALAEIGLTQRKGEYGIEFNTILFSQFLKKLDGLKEEMDSVRETMNALDNANTTEELNGKERLALIQNYLVELLSYMEKRERFSLYMTRGKRKKARVEDLGKKVIKKRYDGWKSPLESRRLIAYPSKIWSWLTGKKEKKNDVTIPHPREPFNPYKTLDNTDINEALDKWCIDYNVPVEHREYWKTQIVIELDPDYENPAGAWVGENGKRHLKARPGFLNSGLIAREQARNSYALISDDEKGEFLATYTLLKTTNPFVVHLNLYMFQPYGPGRDIDRYAEVYGYLGEKMPVELKMYYPKLF